MHRPRWQLCVVILQENEDGGLCVSGTMISLTQHEHTSAEEDPYDEPEELEHTEESYDKAPDNFAYSDELYEVRRSAVENSAQPAPSTLPTVTLKNDEENRGLIHVAAQYGQLQIAEELLGPIGEELLRRQPAKHENRPRWNELTSKGRTPMHFAAEHGHHHIVAMLWQRFCDEQHGSKKKIGRLHSIKVATCGPCCEPDPSGVPFRQVSILEVTNDINPFLVPDKEFRTPLGYAYRSYVTYRRALR